MTLGKKIAGLRRQKDMTQEMLAGQLGVSNQAVSKWEADTCCPDISLLPKIADIFEITLDELFDREVTAIAQELPWEDDGNLRAVLYVGRKLVGGHPAAKQITFTYEGPALNVQSAFAVNCDDVQGNVQAEGSVTCGDVEGDVHAAGSVNCDDVAGSVQAEGTVNCDAVAGNVNAGGSVACDEVGGSVTAGGSVTCDSIGGFFR